MPRRDQIQTRETDIRPFPSCPGFATIDREQTTRLGGSA